MFSVYYTMDDDMDMGDEDMEVDTGGENMEANLDKNELLAMQLADAGFMRFCRCSPKNSCRFILFAVLRFIGDNPPPATIALVSGNTDFAPFLQKLQGQGYEVLVAASSKEASSAFRDAGLTLHDPEQFINGDGFLPLEEVPPSRKRKKDLSSSELKKKKKKKKN